MHIILLQADLSLFIGRLHPLIVHLPIGFLLLAIIFYFLAFFERFKPLKNAIQYILLFGAVSALMSVGVGLLLSSNGGYNVDVLGWHKWLAIVLVIISFALWAWFKWGKEHKVITTGLMATVLLLITATGHLGGTLTHGERYVYEYAPDFVRTQFLVHNGIEPDKLPKDADSILVYADLIQPVFDLKCIACHNNDNRSGGLNLTSLDSLLVGSDNGEVLIAGNVPNSEIFKRVSMNPSDRKFMPTNGTPLSYTEILLLKEWISHDLDTTMAISSERLSPELKSRLAISYGLDARKKSFMEKLQLPLIAPSVLEKIESNGFTIRKLAEHLNLLDIKSKDSISLEQLEILMEVKDHIVWLDIHGSKVGEEHLTQIALLKNLVRLDLHHNPIISVEVLTGLQHLEVLNVHSTKVNDSIVGAIEKFPSLKVLYLWQSAISEQAVDSLRNLLPDLEVNFGFKLKVVVADKDKKE
jgi:uncharacterized membrane protein